MSSYGRSPRNTPDDRDRDRDRNRDSYFYNPATGTYIPTQRRPSHPPPIPPKELEAGFVTKETQHGFAAELEGDSDIGRLSLDEKPTSGRSSERARKKDKEKEKGKKHTVSRQKRNLRVLSLDGGGIRGYSTLVILGELMQQIYLLTHGGKGPASPSDLPRPCDYFDLIGGTGTGGLIALMLGRMRMDVESCKQYYVELTRYVFITDKTLMGVPYGKTLFKASRLEEAIRHCVRESTRSDNDKIIPHSPPPKRDDQKRIENRRSNSWRNALGSPVRRQSSSLDREEVRGRRGRASDHSQSSGNAEALLLDSRQGACKTFVTAVYKGTPPNSSGPAVLLRTYPSRAESAPDYNCTIWQAGRATSATLSAFKPITVGQNTFLDEGSGRYNPAQQVLEEAHINEFPDDGIAVFISVGTGKRPDTPPSSSSRSPAHQSYHHHSHSSGDRSQWWEGILSTPFEEFTEARRRLMTKLDDCERVHHALIDPEDGGRPGLAKMGVAREDYYRFNVEVGVGEFALNEWNRLPEVSTNTRRYIAQRETSKLVRECAQKMVNIEIRNTSQARRDPPVSPAPPRVRPSLPRQPDGVAELSGETGFVAPDWARPISPPHEPHPSQRPFSPIEQIVAYPPEPPQPPQLPMVPPKPPKPAKPLYPESPHHADHPYFGAAAGAPNPEIRVTSPTTVAGDSDDERRVGTGRRRRDRSGSHSGGSGRRR